MIEIDKGVVAWAIEAESIVVDVDAARACRSPDRFKGRGSDAKAIGKGKIDTQLPCAQVRSMWLEVSEQVLDEGACFDRPYGPWADMVYSRAGVYTQKLKELKRALDPNNVMNPGRLCF